MDDCKFRMVEIMYLYLSGAITDEEMQELQKWLDAAPENRAMFDRFVRERIFYTSIECTRKLTIEQLTNVVKNEPV